MFCSFATFTTKEDWISTIEDWVHTIDVNPWEKDLYYVNPFQGLIDNFDFHEQHGNINHHLRRNRHRQIPQLSLMATQLVTYGKFSFFPTSSLTAHLENPTNLSILWIGLASFGPRNYLNDPNASYKKKLDGLLYFSAIDRLLDASCWFTQWCTKSWPPSLSILHSVKISLNLFSYFFCPFEFLFKKVICNFDRVIHTWLCTHCK